MLTLAQDTENEETSIPDDDMIHKDDQKQDDLVNYDKAQSKDNDIFSPLIIGLMIAGSVAVASLFIFGFIYFKKKRARLPNQMAQMATFSEQERLRDDETTDEEEEEEDERAPLNI
eukprot:69524_1